MSALCRVCWRLFAVFCLSAFTTLWTKVETVEWRNAGASITIKCKWQKKQQDPILIKVMKGLDRDEQFFFKLNGPVKEVFAFPSRTKIHGTFPNLQILLTNLTVNDTGVYWCMYRDKNMTVVGGDGSLLLAVRDPIHGGDKSTTQPCNPADSNKNLIVTSVIISSALLAAILLALFLLVIRKSKYFHGKNKSRPVPHNDVYEEMRGTIRR